MIKNVFPKNKLTSVEMWMIVAVALSQIAAAKHVPGNVLNHVFVCV